MTLQPDKLDDIYTRIRDAIAAASNITNFSPNSPERAITRDGFAEEMRERQHEALYVQLATRVDYAGRGTDNSEDPIDANVLENLDVTPENVDLDLLNSYMKASDLDAVAVRNSITRDPGDFATGSVEFTTASDSVVVPEGTEVATPPDADGDSLVFATVEEVSPGSGSTTVSANIQAEMRGSEYNVGAGTITRLPSPPPGVEGVTNPSATTGGEDEEDNASLRKRTKSALVGVGGGGTTQGVKTGLVEAFDGLELNDILVNEFPTADPQYFDVVVNGGGTDTDVANKIDELQPVGIDGNLVRPSRITIDITADVTTDGAIDTNDTENEVADYIRNLGLGDDVIRDQIISAIIVSDSDIVGVSSLSTSADGTSYTGDYTVGSQETAEAGTITINVV